MTWENILEILSDIEENAIDIDDDEDTNRAVLLEKFSREDIDTAVEWQGVIDTHSEEIAQAAHACDIQPADVDECYAGQWRSDEEFAQHLIKETGGLPKDLPNYIYIDWERTAHDLMMDYSEDNGYYFRNI